MSGISDAIAKYNQVKEGLAGTLGPERQKDAILEAKELIKNPHLTIQLRESLKFQVDELEAKGISHD